MSNLLIENHNLYLCDISINEKKQIELYTLVSTNGDCELGFPIAQESMFFINSINPGLRAYLHIDTIVDYMLNHDIKIPIGEFILQLITEILEHNPNPILSTLAGTIIYDYRTMIA